MKKVACGSFVKRQTPESGHSHFNGTWEQLEVIAAARLDKGTIGGMPGVVRPGYKEGVLLVEMPAQWFRSAIIELNEDSRLTANFAPRRENEAPFIRVSAKSKKQPARYVQVVLYSRAVLMENNEAETDADWEIVCIKARVTEEEEPMDPYTMARNFLHLAGGTKGDFSAEQFAKSIVYWNEHCMTTGKPKWYKRIANWWRGDQ